MSNTFDIVLLLALPASGKSEVRRFLANIEPERLKKDFHIGQNMQLDDFPYVHLMRRIDDELAKIGEKRVFFKAGTEPFLNPNDWGTLINLLNEDYYDLMNRTRISCASAAELLFTRMERAAQIAKIEPRLAKLSKEARSKLAAAIEKEAKALQQEKEAAYADSYEGKTLVIEAARGGPDGSSLPLKAPFGYQYSLAQFCPEILEKAVILYIWVTPEESRRKNLARTDPNDPGSIINHGVPLSVMLNDYGCDDMKYLEEHSEVKDTITVNAHGKTYHLPIGSFDNRVDRTTFLRGDPKAWDKQKVAEITESIKGATDKIYENYSKK